MKTFGGLAIASLAIVFLFGIVGLNIAQAATEPDLGTAGSFAVLGGSAVTNTGSSVITGNLGVSPGSAVTGFPPGDVSGMIYSADSTAGQAQADLTDAYLEAQNQSCDTNLTGQDLGGLTLTQGTYCFDSSAGLTGTLTLDAEGDPNAVFIFQVGSALTTASGSSVSLINSGRACKVFWQVTSSATLGTTTDFKGNILALTSITLNTGATIEDGRALARNGSVTLDTSNIARAICTGEDASNNENEDEEDDNNNDDEIDIKVRKEANPSKLSGPGLVTYTYKVSNEGDVSLRDISVEDDKCSPVIYVSGKKNKNGKLDTDEVWKYTCTKKVSATETNKVTAKGTGGGDRVKDTANATVIVSSVPGFPSAGIGPDNDNLWDIISQKLLSFLSL